MSNDKYAKKTIYVFDAQPEMILADDVLRHDGSLIAKADTALDFNTITKISDNHILEISIYDIPEDELSSTSVNDSESGAAADNNSDSKTYYERIKSTPEFKVFKQDYDNNVASLQVKLNDILTNTNDTIDTDELLKEPLAMFNRMPNKLQMFDMLHSLRGFDDQTYTHSINVALVASIIGQWLKYSDKDIHILLLAGVLHDIGKLAIPEDILKKPGRLTPQEYEIVKTHVTKGYDIIKNKNLDPRIKEAVLLHHEKCDGSGYPFRLKSDKISDFAKIITIADIYDAMTSKRVYRNAVCPFKVVGMMESEAFSKLDPKFTLIFLRNVVNSYIHTNVMLSNGQTGQVVLINNNDLSHPIIKSGNEYLDLSKRAGLDIYKIL